MNDIMCRLDTTFKLNTTTENIVGFDENPDLSGLEHFSPLFNAIINKQALKIKYAPAFGNIEINTIHPYYLKQYNNRWFLFALNHSEEGKIKNYALDRIEHIEVSKINYIENTIVEFENYFDDVVGVSVPYNKESQTIRLKIDRKSYNYIKTKPLHHTQKELKKECTDEYAVIELKLIPNYEFETVLLGFADSIDILEPQSLKDSIYRRAGNILKRINPAMQI